MTRPEQDSPPPVSFPPHLKGEMEEIEEAYLDSLRKGEAPDREAICSAHPELADFLQEHLAMLDMFLSTSSGCGRQGRSGGNGEISARLRPERIGPYGICDVLGEGGMGVVYLAEQSDPVQRRVALKLIKRGMDTDDVVARFESERQALALMEHPGIAKVFDGGATEAGRPYFVMEYVPGRPITDYCNERRLPTSERLQLFAAVCDAVQHAHQKGIIHRDLKPSNILVTESASNPVPKIIDFGVAKATGPRLSDRSVFTEHGRIMGTVEYMSPEQVGGKPEDLDTRTDLYSLGVILYELLTGALPFDARDLRIASPEEVVRKIREDDPPKPSTRVGSLGEASTTVAELRRTDPTTLCRLLRGDLDWITMKTMEKDPARRYASASELAADVARHLRVEPVLAGPPAATYRLKKFVRKHRAAVAAGLAVALSLVGGLVVSTVLYIDAGKQRDAAEAARQAEAAQRDKAQKQAERAEATIGALQRLLASVNPVEVGGEVKLGDVLKRASREIEKTLPDDPLVEARLRSTIGNSYLGLGLYDAAAPHLKTALEIYERIHGMEHPRTLGAMARWGHIVLHQAHLPEAEALFKKVLDARRRCLGEAHPDTLSSVHFLAVALRVRGRLAESEVLFREALKERRRVLGMEHEDTLSTMNSLAFLLQMRGRLPEAEDLYLEEVRIRRKTHGEEHPQMLLSLGTLATLQKEEGKWDEAEETLRRILEVGERVLGPDHPHTLEWKSSLGGLALGRGNMEEAEKLNQEVLESFRNAQGENHLSTLSAMNNHATILRARGKLGRAEQLQREALEGQRQILGEDHHTTVKSMGNLGLLLAEQRRIAEAEPLLRKSMEIRRRILGEDHPETLKSANHLAHLLQCQGKDVEAEKLFREAMERQRAVLGEKHPDALAAMHDLGQFLNRRGRRQEALPLLQEVTESRRNVLGEGHRSTIASMEVLAVALAGEGNRGEAETLLRWALELKCPAGAKEDVLSLSLKHNLGSLLRLQGNESEAEGLLREAMAGRRMIFGDVNNDTLQSMGSLADLLRERGDTASSERLFRRVIDIARQVLPKGHWQMAYYQRNHGKCLLDLGKYGKAEKRLLRGYAGLRDAKGPDHEQTRFALRWLMDLYAAWDKPGKGEKYSALLSAPPSTPTEE